MKPEFTAAFLFSTFIVNPKRVPKQKKILDNGKISPKLNRGNMSRFDFGVNCPFNLHTFVPLHAWTWIDRLFASLLQLHPKLNGVFTPKNTIR